jgi:hypothetical protein
MATEETTQPTAEAAAAPTPTPATDGKPVLTDTHKFNVRDLQLKQQTSGLNFQNAANAARQAEANFRAYIAKMAEEVKVDVSKWQLNLDTLEFEPRATPAPAPPASNAQPAA